MHGDGVLDAVKVREGGREGREGEKGTHQFLPSPPSLPLSLPPFVPRAAMS